MSYSPSEPGAYRIDIVDHAGRAYRAVLDNLQLVLEMALLPYALVLGIELVVFLIPGTGIFGHLLAAFLRAVAFLVFGSVFAVRWHRFVLLGESVSGGMIPPGWTPFLLAGIKVAVLIFAGWIVLFLLALVLPALIGLPLSAIGGIALGLASLRVAMMFPSAAIEQPLDLRTAWDWIEGNFWRLFGSVLACYLPFIIVGAIVGWFAALFPSLLWIVFEAVNLAVSFTGAAVIGALLSHIYLEFSGGPPAAAG